MSKPGNDSELARLSAGLDEELAAIFDQVEAALRPENDQWDETSAPDPLFEADNDQWYETPAPDPLFEAGEVAGPALAPAYFPAEESLADLAIGLAPTDDEPPFSEPEAAGEAEWLPPGLLGEPEAPAGLSPEALRELSRLIEAAVEKGVAAALAKLKT